MNEGPCKDYFIHPVEASHRRYEALRSVFVEELPMLDVAQRYGISYGTVRNWASEFCGQQDAGQSPPFSPHPHADVPRNHSLSTITSGKSQ